MAKLNIALLGGFRVILDGQPLQAFESDKSRALLAYLVVENQRSHRRESLAALLWPNRPEARARMNLRQALHRLHQSVDDLSSPTPFLLANSQEIQFNRDSDYTLDVEIFRQQLALFQSQHLPGALPGEDYVECLKKAVSLYAGDFLTGFSLPTAAQFQWWVVYKQEEYHRLAMQALTELANYYEGCEDYPSALQSVRQIIALEPWFEPAHQHCMRLLALSGQRAAALRQYEACQEILVKEMGIAPSSLTTLLRQQILNEE